MTWAHFVRRRGSSDMAWEFVGITVHDEFASEWEDEARDEPTEADYEHSIVCIDDFIVQREAEPATLMPDAELL